MASRWTPLSNKKTHTQTPIKKIAEQAYRSEKRKSLFFLKHLQHSAQILTCVTQVPNPPLSQLKGWENFKKSYLHLVMKQIWEQMRLD